MKPLQVEKRELAGAAAPTSIYRIETREGTRQFKVPERREITAPATVELEERDDSASPVIRGHAAVFDSRSEDLGGFTEYVARGAFRKALDRDPDTKALFNHDPNIVLGNTRNNTLDMREDPKGLHYYATPPNTQAAADVRELIRAGYVTQSSFAFSVERDRWEENEEGEVVRTILEMRDIFDVSPVTYPAYAQTDASARELAEASEEEPEARTSPEASVEDAEAEQEAQKVAAQEEFLRGAQRRLAIARAKTP